MDPEPSVYMLRLSDHKEIPVLCGWCAYWQDGMKVCHHSSNAAAPSVSAEWWCDKFVPKGASVNEVIGWREYEGVK